MISHFGPKRGFKVVLIICECWQSANTHGYKLCTAPPFTDRWLAWYASLYVCGLPPAVGWPDNHYWICAYIYLHVSLLQVRFLI